MAKVKKIKRKATLDEKKKQPQNIENNIKEEEDMQEDKKVIESESKEISKDTSKEACKETNEDFKENPIEPKQELVGKKNNDFLMGLILGLIIVIVCALIVFLFEFEYISSLEKKIEKLGKEQAFKGEFEKLSPSVSKLEASNITLKEQNEAIKTSMANMQERLNVLENQLKEQLSKADLEVLNTRITALENRIGSQHNILKEQIDVNKETFTKELSAAQTKVDDLINNINVLMLNRLSALENRILSQNEVSSEEAIEMQEKLNALENRSNIYESKMQEYISISENQLFKELMEETRVNLPEELNKIRKQIDTLQAALDTLKKQVETKTTQE